MEGALSESVNTIAVDVLMQAGIHNVIETARDLGIKTDLPQVPSLALGVASISLKDLLLAYATIVTRGLQVEPYYLVSISNSNNELLEEFKRPAGKLTDLNPINCRIITHMMESAVNEGTGTKIRTVYKIPGDFAGKTGTTQNQSDGWFVGLTPHLATGCWVGGEEPGIHFRTITYGQGSYMALPIVGKFFHKLYGSSRYQNLKNTQFPNLDDQLLANLDIPPYKEMLEMERRDGLLDRLFAGKSKEEKLNEAQDTEKKEEEKKGLWKSIKSIFKKKDK
jgi:penicillin-binding protein 1A